MKSFCYKSNIGRYVKIYFIIIITGFIYRVYTIDNKNCRYFSKFSYYYPLNISLNIFIQIVIINEMNATISQFLKFTIKSITISYIHFNFD